MAALRPYTDARTHRGEQFKQYQYRAMAVLNYEPAYQWLTSTEKEINAGTGFLRMAILSELGRVRDDDVLRQWAAEVCELKPTSKAAVAMIRKARLREQGKVSARPTRDTIKRRAIRWLAREFPDVPASLAAEALRDAADALEQAAESE